MLEFLKEKGEALKNFLDKDEEEKEETSSVEKLLDFQKAKEDSDISMTSEQKQVANTDDTSETESIEQILKDESSKKEEEGKEKDLDEKLKDIEKVISAFGNQTPLSTSSKTPFTKDLNLNKPIDFSTTIAKGYVTPMISPSTSQDDRIALLYENLKKQNLI
tara:strand:- start:230 stop:715 length:486 start_codon:yes stop_codon:yes gene_type:complete